MRARGLLYRAYILQDVIDTAGGRGEGLVSPCREARRLVGEELVDSRRVIVAPYDDLHVATTSIGEDSGLAAVAIAGIEARIDATQALVKPLSEEIDCSEGREPEGS